LVETRKYFLTPSLTTEKERQSSTISQFSTFWRERMTVVTTQEASQRMTNNQNKANHKDLGLEIQDLSMRNVGAEKYHQMMKAFSNKAP
jgi:hypothetical protein